MFIEGWENVHDDDYSARLASFHKNNVIDDERLVIDLDQRLILEIFETTF